MNRLDFKISSGLKNIIGKELITNDRIAIFELVKNAYDANARNVRIVFHNIKNTTLSTASKIIIIDDGDGMSYKDLTDKWLFVGYSEKRTFDPHNFRDKINNKRIFAGAKGVGRFSCDRLGAKLRLYTKKLSEHTIHSIEVDWTQFEENQKKEFQTIKVDYSVPEKVSIPGLQFKQFRQGTILEISALNDRWDGDKLLELRKYLQRLVNPTAVAGADEFEIFLEADEYLRDDQRLGSTNDYGRINGRIQNAVFEKLEDKTTKIKSIVSESKITTELVDKGKFIFALEERNEWPLLKNITVNLYFLNPSAKNSFTRIMGMEPVKYGSIFLYRNQFRIHPYGDEGDDWLGLEKRKGQGYARHLASRELMGRIEVQGKQSSFNEVSSRDGGVIKTPEYYDLISFFTEKVLRRLERYVIEGIDWDSVNPDKHKTSDAIKRDSLELIQRFVGQVRDPEKHITFNPELLSILRDKQIENLPQVIKNVETIQKHIKDPDERAYIEKQINSVKLATKTLALEKNANERKLQVKERESLFLSKAISTDKDIIVNLNHTIENSTLMIKEIILVINEKIRANRPIIDIVQQIDKLSIENEKIKVLAGIVSMANFNTKIELIRADVVVYIKEYLEKTTSPDILRLKFYNDNVTEIIKFRPLEISILLDNLISNAKKAGASVVSVQFERIGKKMHIFVADDGKGVAHEIEGSIFTRGFTTTRGAGIGLHHIKTIVEGMGGDVRFVGNNQKALGKGACFEVVLP